MWVLFDLNGTLVDPAALAAPLGVDGAFVLAALDEANMAAMVATLGGFDAPFTALLESALRRRLAAAGRAGDGVPAALERLAEMPPYPDAAEALDALRAGGCSLAVLTQSSRDSAETVLRAAGLRDRFAVVASAPEVAFKPDPRGYRHGLAQTGATEAWFVAGHWWDVAGAAAAGLSTAWVSRTDRAYPDALPPPTVRGEGLREVAHAILAQACGQLSLPRPDRRG
jgi:2-haloacid dehalogenase